MLAESSFTLKPEPFIQAYRWLVVCIDLQLQPRQVEPVIRQIKGRAHQRRSDALALPLIVHAHSDCANMPPTGAVLESLHPEHSHHLIANDCHQVVGAVTWIREPPPPMLAGWIR